MNDLSHKTRNYLFWIAAIAVCLGLAMYGWVLRSQAIAVENELVSLRAVLADYEQRKERLGALVAQVSVIQRDQNAEIKVLQVFQKKLTMRDQFLVTSGEKNVRQLAVYAPSSERRMLFYVPAGEHRLVYALREALGLTSETYREISEWGSDHRRIRDTTEVKLSGETVYELRTRVEQVTRTSVIIELIGPENQLMHDDVFPLSHEALQGLNNWQNDSEVFASYPNELRSAGDAKSHVDGKKASPVTPLLTFTLDRLGGKDQDSKGKFKMRFWIDSDAPSCMSDVTVASSYEFLARNLRSVPTPKSTFEGFTKTFQSYDGSGPYFFVDGYFDDAAKP